MVRPVAQRSPVAAIAALFIAALGPGATVAMAGTVTVPAGAVDSTAQPCSAGSCPNLRSAVAYADQNAGTTIQLAAGSYDLSQGELMITSTAGSLTISGAGAGATKIDQAGPPGPADRVFELQCGTPSLTLQNLEVTGGHVQIPTSDVGSGAEDEGGAGILDGANSLTLSGVTLDHNSLAGVDYAVASNSAGGDGVPAYGGGIAQTAACQTVQQINVTRSTVSDNTATAGAGQGSTSPQPGGRGGAALGGGIYSFGTAISISHSTVEGNVATAGAGGAPSASTSQAQAGKAGDGGIAEGGGVYDRAQGLSIDHSAIDGNSAVGGSPGANSQYVGFSGTGGTAQGGALFTLGTLVVSDSTLAANTAAGGADGGGVQNAGVAGPASGGAAFGRDLTFDNSTIARNSATGGPGPGPFAPTNSYANGEPGAGNVTVFTGVSAPSAGSLTLRSTIVSAGTSFTGGGAHPGGNCFRQDDSVGGTQPPTVDDEGYNLEDSSPSQCGLSTGRGDLIGADPLLGTLGNNGGPTATMALAATSPAIGASQACPSDDQRGLPRGNPVCDIGAFEHQAGGGGTTPPPGGGAAGVARAGAPHTSGNAVSVSISCTGASACTVKLTLTATEILRGSKLIALTASARKHKKIVVLGSASVTVPAGRTATVKVSLNALGRRLLKKHKTLRLTLTIKQGTTRIATYRLRLKRR
jgi:hypothetical protein